MRTLGDRCRPVGIDIHSVGNDPQPLVPRYLRVSDAEVKQRVDLTPETPGTDVDFHEGRKDLP